MIRVPSLTDPVLCRRPSRVQFVSLAVVLLRFRTGLASIKYELLAAAAVGLWMLRTLVTYRNAFVRYEALRLRLLTSKTLVRSSVDTRPVVRYISQEAATARARRAELLLGWLTRRRRAEASSSAASEPTTSSRLGEETRFQVSELQGRADELLADYCPTSAEHTPVEVDVAKAVDELHRLGVVQFASGSDASSCFELVPDEQIGTALREHWARVLQSADGRS